MQPWPYIR